MTTLLRIKTFSDRHPAFSEASLRMLIQRARDNGLQDSGAILRNGRAVVIDEARFLGWLDSRQDNVEPLAQQLQHSEPRA